MTKSPIQVHQDCLGTLSEGGTNHRKEGKIQHFGKSTVEEEGGGENDIEQLCIYAPTLLQPAKMAFSF